MPVWTDNRWDLLRELPFFLYHEWERNFVEMDPLLCTTELDRKLWTEKKLMMKFHYHPNCHGSRNKYPKFRLDSRQRIEREGKPESETFCQCEGFREGRQKQLQYQFIRECKMEHASYIQLESFISIDGVTLLLMKQSNRSGSRILQYYLNSITQDGFITNRDAVIYLYHLERVCECGFHSRCSPVKIEIVFPAIKPWRIVDKIASIDDRQFIYTVDRMHYLAICTYNYIFLLNKSKYVEMSDDEDSENHLTLFTGLFETDETADDMWRKINQRAISEHQQFQKKYPLKLRYPHQTQLYRYSSWNDYLTFSFF